MWWWIAGYLAIGWFCCLWVGFKTNLPEMFAKDNPPNAVRILVMLFFFLCWPLIPFIKGLR